MVGAAPDLLLPLGCMGRCELREKALQVPPSWLVVHGPRKDREVS